MQLRMNHIILVQETGGINIEVASYIQGRVGRDDSLINLKYLAQHIEQLTGGDKQNLRCHMREDYLILHPTQCSQLNLCLPPIEWVIQYLQCAILYEYENETNSVKGGSHFKQIVNRIKKDTEETIGI